MNIGDKVRLLHGTEEGVVTRLLDNKLVEVEIEDGFSIPVLQSELVIIDANESSAFGSSEKATQKPTKNKTTKTTQAQHKGYHLAIVPLNDKLHSLYFINYTEEDLLLLVNERNNKAEERTIVSSKVFGKQYLKIAEYNLEHLNTWPDFSFKLLAENAGWSIPNRIQKIDFTIKAKHFQKDAQPNDLLNKKAYLIALNQVKQDSEEFKTIDANALKESFYKERNDEFSKDAPRKTTDSTEIDLHIEALHSIYGQIPENEALDYQLKEFEKKLDEALAAGLDEITFIHGVGNGVLRNAIHKQLSKSDSIAYFKDAQKEKFGYGATLIKLK